MHDVLLESRAQRDLRRLLADVFDRVIRAIKGLADNPQPVGSRKIVG